MIFNGCDTKGDFHVSTIDANGTKQTYNGTANNTLGPWKQELGTALPMNVTVAQEGYPEDVLYITYFDVKSITYKLGDGAVDKLGFC